MPPEVVKALRSVLPKETQLFPVGGITPERIAPYRKAGTGGFGSAAPYTGRHYGRGNGGEGDPRLGTIITLCICPRLSPAQKPG
jgi:hypothetical protein